jgi:TIR domain-containing protein
MSTVFISYRRQTAAGEARALFNDLTARLGENAVFMDVDSISLGRDFRGELQKILAACDLMLVLIDKDWAAAKDEKGRVRLENTGDFVRMEIEAALKRDIVVTPILVKGAQMPAAEELPAEIRDLAYRNGFELSHNRWESDVREMIRRLNLGSHEQIAEVETGRSARLQQRPAAEIPPVPNTPQQIGSSKPPVTYAGWLTRRRLLATGAATMIAGALGGSAYRFWNWGQKEKPITEQKPGSADVNQRMYRAALSFVGYSTANVPGTDSGRLAGAWSVNEIARRALGKPISSAESGRNGLSINELFSALKSRHIQRTTEQARPGMIVVTPSNGNVVGNVGIVGELSRNGLDVSITIYSNNSSRAMFSDNFVGKSWQSYFEQQKGLETYVFEVNENGL